MAKKDAKKAKKPEKYITGRIKVEKIIPGGQALATLHEGADAGKKVFLWNALPGETVVSARVIKTKSSYLEAIATEISQPSPRRIDPADSCYLATSPWQIMDYAAELLAKAEILQEIFRQHKLEIPQVTVKTDGKDLHYRNKMEYALYFSKEDQQIHLAFHQRGSHAKIVIESSSLENPATLARAREIVADLNAKHAEARTYQSILLRASASGEVSGGLLPNGRPHPDFPPLTDQILESRYSYSPGGFFQINLPVYEMALSEIAQHIRTEKVLDLYAGVGTIGLSVAKNHDLTLVECNKSAYNELEKNCQGTKARPVLAKSEEALDFIQPDQTVILDPPRAGCDQKLLEKILQNRPVMLIYLSCNPATQARDLEILCPKYQISQVQPYNFFPRTPHLENLIILERKNGC